MMEWKMLSEMMEWNMMESMDNGLKTFVPADERIASVENLLFLTVNERSEVRLKSFMDKSLGTTFASFESSLKALLLQRAYVSQEVKHTFAAWGRSAHPRNFALPGMFERLDKSDDFECNLTQDAMNFCLEQAAHQRATLDINLTRKFYQNVNNNHPFLFALLGPLLLYIVQPKLLIPPC